MSAHHALALRCNMVSQDNLKWAFRAFDINGDGVVSKDELKRILMLKGPSLRPWSEERVESLFAKLDVNGDGCLSVEELSQGWSELMSGGAARAMSHKGVRSAELPRCTR